MPLLSDYARQKKIEYFFRDIPREARILEIGCGAGWVREHFTRQGWTGYRGLDLVPPADVVGDIRRWRDIGLEASSFDVIVAFEVVEHVDCFAECHELLRPGGRLLLTSPVPHMDWVMKILESLGLNQKRTSPHDHLVYFEKVPWAGKKDIRRVKGLAQWGIFTKERT